MPDLAPVEIRASNGDDHDVVDPLYSLDRSDDVSRIRVLPGAMETAASFQFDKEDHTLGNALRYIIMKNPDVEFCGYSIPHPSEEKLNLRIQTYDGVSVYSVLDKGLRDLEEMCDVITEKFEEARAQKAEKMDVDDPEPLPFRRVG
ncbi:RBP11-like subunits of RNA polymerase [Lophiostoma macrostomum CBS 122681]|uniref:DNA-directed RNA polymerases I and III subunit RPAC2 n=1 Tax=Lophiostoma macrostomum CBS 122681 TaxID=1314788 RepID=A0A6A6SU97_9PLEO|nr:RBP11-like subunits of RNA polymerase [Lophiostoma macrostomum CBS 122681]